MSIKIAVLLTDGFGGFGGIAKFNRDFLTALCQIEDVEKVVAIPRSITTTIDETLPSKLIYCVGAASGKIAFTLKTIALLKEHFDYVIAGHIHLLPLAYLLAKKNKAPLGLMTHGVEAWEPSNRFFCRKIAKKIDHFYAVSRFTLKHFSTWSHVAKGYLLFNCIDLAAFKPGKKDLSLLKKYDLLGKKVLLTLARYDSKERYKGVDEIFDIFLKLKEKEPNLVYVVAGIGDDLLRLKEKARTMGISGMIRFVGLVPESEKQAWYQTADGFTMAGSGEGFGIVYLEALACALPVVGSLLDGSQDALQDGALGVLVNPKDRDSLLKGVLKALNSDKKVPEGLKQFSVKAYQKRVQEILKEAIL